jgi:hypothetical protein
LEFVFWLSYIKRLLATLTITIREHQTIESAAHTQ